MLNAILNGNPSVQYLVCATKADRLYESGKKYSTDEGTKNMIQLFSSVKNKFSLTNAQNIEQCQSFSFISLDSNAIFKAMKGQFAAKVASCIQKAQDNIQGQTLVAIQHQCAQCIDLFGTDDFQKQVETMASMVNILPILQEQMLQQTEDYKALLAQQIESIAEKHKNEIIGRLESKTYDAKIGNLQSAIQHDIQSRFLNVLHQELKDHFRAFHYSLAGITKELVKDETLLAMLQDWDNAFDAEFLSLQYSYSTWTFSMLFKLTKQFRHTTFFH